MRALSRAGNGRPGTEDAVRQGYRYLLDNGPEPGDPLGPPQWPAWNEKHFSYGFTLSALSEMEPSEDKNLAVRNLVGEMEKLQLKDGTFGYRTDGFGTSFHTAAALLGLLDILEDRKELDEAVAAKAEWIMKKTALGLSKTRLPQGHFSYYADLSAFASTPKGSAPRSIFCAYTLYRAGTLEKEELRKALDLFFEYRGNVIRAFEATDGELTHQEDKDQAAPYYYLLSHYFAALTVKELGDVPPARRQELERGILRMQEKAGDRLAAREGAFFDSVYGGRSYGAAIALLALDVLK